MSCEYFIAGEQPVEVQFKNVISLLKQMDLSGQIQHSVTSHDGGNVYLLRILLVSGAAVDEHDSEGLTPLAHAVRLCREDICKVLLDHGAK